MRQLYRKGVLSRLMEPSELADDDLVAVCSNMGAPLVGQERLTNPKTMALAVTMMEEYLGRKFRAVMSLESAGAIPSSPSWQEPCWTSRWWTVTRLGIDVGGTNTDAVLLEDDLVAEAVRS